MSEETTTEQLTAIETQATEYTPPEGWQEVPLGEPLKGGDEYHAGLDRYIRPIEPQPQPEPQPKPVPDAAAIEELRSEVSYVQNLLGESRQRVTQLEELVASLRTINRGCENAVRDAGKENFALKNQLEAVKAELAQVSKDRYALQRELDAAQQVPADSPELRQLRADLEQVTQERDQYLDSYQRIFGDLETIRETTKAETVEAIAEWLQAFRGCNSPALALLLLEALPSIMRSLTGLADDEDVD